jgi:hypothetical protein
LVTDHRRYNARMIQIFGKLDEIKNAIRRGIFARLLAVLLGGSLNQRAFVVIGLALALGSIYNLVLHLWLPLLLTAVGFVLTYLAIQDYERTLGK